MTCVACESGDCFPHTKTATRTCVACESADSFAHAKTAASTPRLKASDVIDYVVAETRRLVPETVEIWFHGSRATGKQKRTSDWDFIAVLPDDIPRDRFIDLSLANSPLARMEYPPNRAVELHVIPEHMADKDSQGSVLWWATEEGKLVWKGAETKQAVTATPAATLIADFKALLRSGELGKVQVKFKPTAPGSVELFFIKVPEKQRGQGMGSNALRAVCVLADKLGVTLTVDVTPADDNGLGFGDLLEWYDRNGFASDDPGNEWAERRTRKPRQAEAKQAAANVTIEADRTGSALRILAKDDMRVVGQLTTKVDGDSLRVVYVTVDKAFQRQGIATAMYRKLFEEAEKDGFSAVYSDHALKPGAKALWKKLQKEDSSIVREKYEDDFDTGHRYRRPLKQAAKKCKCGHSWDEHVHMADFGCKHEKDGCGCTGFDDGNQVISKKGSLTQEEMVREAEAFEDHWDGEAKGYPYNGHPANIAARELLWEVVPNFDLHKLADFADTAFWKWMVREMWDRAKESADTLEGAKAYYTALKQAIHDGSVEPILVVEGKDHKFYLWDGNHRTGMAIHDGITHLPAWVGYQMTSKTAALTAPVLYHGTCAENAELLIAQGFTPGYAPSGANQGQNRYLYLTNDSENARWFAEEKGCDTVIAVSDIPLSALAVDPEDGTYDSLEEELSLRNGLPGSVVLTQSLPAGHFSILNGTEDSKGQAQ